MAGAELTISVAAVSTSQPAWHDVNGVSTITSIVHTPTEIIQLTADGIVGNATAAHSGPIYVFFAHHYDYWSTSLSVPRTSWNWCHWGENITLKCSMPTLTEHDVRLGDEWSIGDDVRLQVCGSRVPCSKLSWRLGQSAKWLKDLADSGFCGFYMRVVTGGNVRPGDAAKIVKRQPDKMSCAAISKLAFESGLDTKKTLNLLVGDPYLLGMLRRLFERKLSLLEDSSRLNQNSWSSWAPLMVFRVTSESPSIKSFYLKRADSAPLATYLPGQFLTVRLPNGLVRTWSISDWTSPAAPKYYRLSIKKQTKGSRWMHENCHVGTNLQCRAPAGSFHLDWTPMWVGRQVYISAGIGVTPLLAMLKAHTSHPAVSLAPAIWIHVSRDSDALPDFLTSEIKDLSDHPMVKLARFFTKPQSKDMLGVEFEYPGRPGLEELRAFISAPYAVNPLSITPIEIPGPHSTFYICGPSSFETGIKNHLRKLGVSDDMIRSETFSEAALPASTVRKGKIRFAKSKKTVDWDSGEMDCKTILEIAENAGLAPEYGCRVGSCGSCKTVVICGSVAGGVQPNGEVHICSTKPASEFVEIDI